MRFCGRMIAATTVTAVLVMGVPAVASAGWFESTTDEPAELAEDYIGFQYGEGYGGIYQGPYGGYGRGYGYGPAYGYQPGLGYGRRYGYGRGYGYGPGYGGVYGYGPAYTNRPAYRNYYTYDWWAR